MDIEQFQDLVDLHGEDLSRWPWSEQTAAASLLARSEEARQILKRSEQLRALLSRPTTIRAPANLVDGIMARVAVAEEREADVRSIPTVGPWYERVGQGLQSTALLSCLAFGFALGALTIPQAEAPLAIDAFSIFAGLVQ